VYPSGVRPFSIASEGVILAAKTSRPPARSREADRSIDLGGGSPPGGPTLQPNSALFVNIVFANGLMQTNFAGYASSNGTFSGAVFEAPPPGAFYTVTGTAADGSPVSSNTITCSP
jgi:hypothetical protein